MVNNFFNPFKKEDETVEVKLTGPMVKINRKQSRAKNSPKAKVSTTQESFNASFSIDLPLYLMHVPPTLLKAGIMAWKALGGPKHLTTKAKKAIDDLAADLKSDKVMDPILKQLSELGYKEIYEIASLELDDRSDLFSSYALTIKLKGKDYKYTLGDANDRARQFAQYMQKTHTDINDDLSQGVDTFLTVMPKRTTKSYQDILEDETFLQRAQKIRDAVNTLSHEELTDRLKSTLEDMPAEQIATELSALFAKAERKKLEALIDAFAKAAKQNISGVIDAGLHAVDEALTHAPDGEFDNIDFKRIFDNAAKPAGAILQSMENSCVKTGLVTQTNPYVAVHDYINQKILKI